MRMSITTITLFVLHFTGNFTVSRISPVDVHPIIDATRSNICPKRNDSVAREICFATRDCVRASTLALVLSLAMKFHPATRLVQQSTDTECASGSGVNDESPQRVADPDRLHRAQYQSNWRSGLLRSRVSFRVKRFHEWESIPGFSRGASLSLLPCSLLSFSYSLSPLRVLLFVFNIRGE